jgi:hypothetical protein
MENITSGEAVIDEAATSFKDAKNADNDKGNLFLYRAVISGVVIISLVVFKVFFPDIYVVLNSWLTEKINLPPLSL